MRTSIHPRKRFCPLCGEEIFDVGEHVQEGATAIHYFLCKNRKHSCPYILTRYDSDVDDISDWKIYITGDMKQAVVRNRNDYCFLCGSELAQALQYFNDEGKQDGDNKIYFFYECIQEGHIWCVVDNTQYILFCFISLATFDKLYLTCYTVSSHHVRIPHRLSRRGLQNLKYDIIEF